MLSPEQQAFFSMADPEDFVRMGYTVKHFNECYLLFDQHGKLKVMPNYSDRYNKPAKVVVLGTNMEAGNYYVATAVADTASRTLGSQLL